MIIYFANRKMEILGNASTHLPNGYMIADDIKTEDIETGVACFECKLPYSDDDRTELAEFTEVGNYILRSHEKENEFYTIIETETDTKDQTIYIYAEDAGLDLLNEIAPAYEATETHTAEWYVNKWTYDSGFEIGINEIPDTRTRKLSWDSEQTVTERLASIATGFGGFEVSYSFDVDRLIITHKYINIYEKRGKDNGVQLRLNNEVDRIVTTKSIANVATALKCTGGIPEKAEKPITLSGYSYDDGDFFVDGVYLKSREALADWSRYAPEKVIPEHSGHIVQLYEYDTLSQATLCSHAITELKKLRQIEVNYEVDIKNLPDGVAIGDRVNIIDDDGKLYLSTRLLKLETSVANNEVTATLGEYLIKSDGISEKVEQMATDFAKNSASTQKANLLAYEAMTTATEAGTAAADAQLAADNAQTVADNAQTAANTAQTAADNAQTAANTAQTVAADAQIVANNAQIAADNAQTAAEDAAKSATDYISPQSASSADDGIKVFPRSEKDNPQNYAQINQYGMQIYKGGQKTASFGSEKISLGENSEQSVLEMCGGLASLSSEVTTDIAGGKLGYILLAPTEFAQSKDYPFRVGIASGKRDSSIYLGDAECEMGAYLTPRAASINYIQSAVSGSSQFDLNEEYPEDGPHAYTSIGMHAGMGLSDGSEPGAGIGMDAHLDNATGKVKSTMDIYADDLTVDVKDAKFNGTININGIPIKCCHKIRTSLTGAAGSYTYDSIGRYMLASQKVYLEEKLSEQQNGIILVWSAYSSGVPQNWAFNFTVVPKAFISDDLGGGVNTFIIEGAPLAYAANKYMYIYDDYIVGHDSNASTGTSATAIKYTNNRFVLRWVYGF